MLSSSCCGEMGDLALALAKDYMEHFPSQVLSNNLRDLNLKHLTLSLLSWSMQFSLAAASRAQEDP